VVEWLCADRRLIEFQSHTLEWVLVKLKK